MAKQTNRLGGDGFSKIIEYVSLLWIVNSVASELQVIKIINNMFNVSNQ
ncbi:MAG: hypothetical protein PUK83_04950 [Clostridia bacterium]|nr:hypothetical protein [Clostridia bacterium]MDY5264168.1 hypothetical protein [Eubacteriales bacterium]